MALPTPTHPDDLRSTSDRIATPRHRVTLLFATILVTSLGGLIVTLQFPTESEGLTYAIVTQNPRGLWVFLLAAGANLAIGIPALAIAGMMLARRRGTVWATVGGATMWLGAGAYAVGIGNWAGMFASAVHPAVPDESTSRALVDAVNADTLLMWAAPGGGAALVALGTVLLSVGLWRARTVPRWIPIVAAVGIVSSFVAPTAGPMGLLVEGPIAASSIAIGWHAWRHAGTRDRRSRVGGVWVEPGRETVTASS